MLLKSKVTIYLIHSRKIQFLQVMWTAEIQQMTAFYRQTIYWVNTSLTQNSTLFQVRKMRTHLCRAKWRKVREAKGLMEKNTKAFSRPLKHLLLGSFLNYEQTKRDVWGTQLCNNSSDVRCDKHLNSAPFLLLLSHYVCSCACIAFARCEATDSVLQSCCFFCVYYLLQC